MADAHKNFATSLVATAPSPATSGTSLVVTGADGAKFPTAPFNATIWPAGVQPTTTNAEIVRVTNISTDTFTIVRTQESTSARTVIVGDQISANITAKTLTDAENPLTGVTGGTVAASIDSIGIDVLEVSATDSLELPATSSLEVVPTVKQAEVQSYFGIYDFIETGCVWTADSAGSTLNATMTDGYVWINGRRLRVNAVRSRAFTASKDTYVDFSDAGNGTATIIYPETTNNVSTGSLPLPAGYLRNAIIVTAAASIAAAASINQGQETMLVPIVSSIPYAVTDSLGNLICPRDPNRKILGYKQITTNATVSTSTATLVTGLSVPVLIPLGRKALVTLFTSGLSNTAGPRSDFMDIWDGTVGSGTQISGGDSFSTAAGNSTALTATALVTPATSSKIYNAAVHTDGAGTATFAASAARPAYLLVELK